MAERHTYTCFISAPLNTKIDNIKQVLSKYGIRILGNEVSGLAPFLRATTLELIAQADLVIGVLTHEKTSESVYIELGIAVGLRKRIMLFAPPKSDIIPSDLQQFLTIRTSLQNYDAINFALSQVLTARDRSSSSKSETVPTGISLGENANRFISRYAEIISSNHHERLETLVADAIRASGVEVVAESPGHMTRIDLAVWSDAFQQSIGNPLLIEVKRQLRSVIEFKQASKQLAVAARNAGSTWSLLLYGKGPSHLSRSLISAPTVLAISIPMLFETMKSKPFVDVVLELRNRRMHGGS